jgi:hypothetical protein
LRGISEETRREVATTIVQNEKNLKMLNILIHKFMNFDYIPFKRFYKLQKNGWN